MSRTLRNLFVLVCCLVCALAAASVYVPAGTARWAAAAAGGVFLAPAVQARLDRRSDRKRLEQCGFLFQVLLSRVSVGDSLETAFSAALNECAAAWGGRSAVSAALRSLVSDLDSRTPMRQALERFSRRISCREAEPVLAALAGSRFAGSGIQELLRTGQGMVAESLAAADSAAAESSQRRAEAMVVAVMPTAAAASLENLVPGYLEPLLASPSGSWIMAALCTASVISVAAVLRILSETTGSQERKHSGHAAGRHARGAARSKTAFPAAFSRISAALFPAVYRVRMERRLDQAGRSGPDRFARYAAAKAGLALIGAAAGTLLNLAGGPRIAIPLLAAGLPVFQDRDLLRSAGRRQREMVFTFPVFLGLLAALLHAGFSLSNALDVCHQAIRDSDGVLGRELAEIRAESHAGRSAGAGFERLAEKASAPELQSTLSLIAQFERTGGHELVSLLRMQVPVCRALSRNAARKRLEERAVLLLLPMTLDLVVILAIAGLPAVMALR